MYLCYNTTIIILINIPIILYHNCYPILMLTDIFPAINILFWTYYKRYVLILVVITYYHNNNNIYISYYQPINHKCTSTVEVSLLNRVILIYMYIVDIHSGCMHSTWTHRIQQLSLWYMAAMHVVCTVFISMAAGTADIELLYGDCNILLCPWTFNLWQTSSWPH